MEILSWRKNKKVERTSPGSKNKYKITYWDGQEKWTSDYPGDGKGDSKDKRMQERKQTRPSIESAKDKLDGSVKGYNEGKVDLEGAGGIVDEMVVRLGREVARETIRKWADGKSGKFVDAIKSRATEKLRDKKAGMRVADRLHGYWVDVSGKKYSVRSSEIHEMEARRILGLAPWQKGEGQKQASDVLLEKGWVRITSYGANMCGEIDGNRVFNNRQKKEILDTALEDGMDYVYVENLTGMHLVWSREEANVVASELNGIRKLLRGNDMKEMTAGLAFDITTVDAWGKTILEGLQKLAPHVSLIKSSLGGERNVSLMILVALDPKAEWKGGILENSTYFRLHLENDGVLEMFSGWTNRVNFRKTRVKTPEETIAKIGKYILEVNRNRPPTNASCEKIASELVMVAKELISKIPAKDEFKVGEVFDTNGVTNMKSPVTISNITGNMIKFTDANGIEYYGTQRSQVRTFVNEAGWKKIGSKTAKEMVSSKILKVQLSAISNPDFRPGTPQHDTHIVETWKTVRSLGEAVREAKDFIRDNNLGGGNWNGGRVKDEKGEIFARISYNGRVWESKDGNLGMTNKEIDVVKFDSAKTARDMVGKIVYKDYTIEKSGDNYYVKDPSGHRAFGEVPASVETAKKWIDMDVIEKKGKKASNPDLPDVRRFVRYCMDFYGRNGIYPIRNITEADIMKAIDVRMSNSSAKWGGGDTVDREAIRDIILSWPKFHDAWMKKSSISASGYAEVDEQGLRRDMREMERMEGSAFEKALTRAIADKIKEMKKEGTVGMGVENLMQIVRSPSQSLEGAPRGTNAQYYYAQMFKEICEKEFRGYTRR